MMVLSDYPFLDVMGTMLVLPVGRVVLDPVRCVGQHLPAP